MGSIYWGSTVLYIYFTKMTDENYENIIVMKIKKLTLYKKVILVI